MTLLLCLICVLLVLPVLALASAWWSADGQSWATLAHMVQTVMPEYALTSMGIAVGVGLGVAVVGSATAATVTLFEFRGRRLAEVLLLLPLAMPAYVLAYAWTDTLQFGGPVQTALRGLTGAQGALWPDIRNAWGAIVLFIACLYPYVHLLVRGALAERGVPLMEAARLLGAGPARRILAVALPLARPAIAAGTALALMETLADYGVGAYFGLSTFTTGIYRAWLSMGDRHAAAQLATVLLLVVALLVWAEQSAQRRLRFAITRLGAVESHEARPVPLRGGRALLAWTVCLLPVLVGFVLPVLALLRLLAQGGDGGDSGEVGLPWDRFLGWCGNSLLLAGLTAVLAAALALGLGFLRRRQPGPLLQGLVRAVSLGYAVPGAVVVVGILLPAGMVQSLWPQTQAAAWLTSTLAGLVYAYLVRFSAVALHSVEAGYARLPQSLDESARMLGARHAALWRRVHWPLMRRTAGTAALLVFVDVMKELPATLVLRPFNADTLAIIANQFARDERLAEAALPSLAIVAVGLLPVMLLVRSTRPTR
ncbi:ABC transporter permease [Ideonella livida]|uniref:Iron ABC transporter permease n=1 Tax=Ideonella livida TaxID=2707176 RepID=A0A7C9THZ1_9BURK|nr:iron ABC transporter permease [Ideonella livida]NDY90881.1 iron ABC transporter permease [Ideonella livida]